MSEAIRGSHRSVNSGQTEACTITGVGQAQTLLFYCIASKSRGTDDSFCRIMAIVVVKILTGFHHIRG